MIGILAAVLFVDVLIILVEWKNLKRAGRSTRWITYVVIGMSTIIWVYATAAPRVFYPTKWLNEMFKPFESIR